MSEKAILGAPDLVVEVLSDSSRRHDSVRKRRLFAARGVREYWTVDPEAERTEVYVLEAGEIVKKTESSKDEAASLEAISGFRTRLAEIFRH